MAEHGGNHLLVGNGVRIGGDNQQINKKSIRGITTTLLLNVKVSLLIIIPNPAVFFSSLKKEFMPEKSSASILFLYFTSIGNILSLYVRTTSTSLLPPRQ